MGGPVTTPSRAMGWLLRVFSMDTRAVEWVGALGLSGWGLGMLVDGERMFAIGDAYYALEVVDPRAWVWGLAAVVVALCQVGALLVRGNLLVGAASLLAGSCWLGLGACYQYGVWPVLSPAMLVFTVVGAAQFWSYITRWTEYG